MRANTHTQHTHTHHAHTGTIRSEFIWPTSKLATQRTADAVGSLPQRCSARLGFPMEKVILSRKPRRF